MACQVVVELKAKGVTAQRTRRQRTRSFQAIFDKFVAKTLTKDQAVKEMAKKFTGLITSTPPEDTLLSVLWQLLYEAVE